MWHRPAPRGRRPQPSRPNRVVGCTSGANSVPDRPQGAPGAHLRAEDQLWLPFVAAAGDSCIRAASLAIVAAVRRLNRPGLASVRGRFPFLVNTWRTVTRVRGALGAEAPRSGTARTPREARRHATERGPGRSGTRRTPIRTSERPPGHQLFIPNGNGRPRSDTRALALTSSSAGIERRRPKTAPHGTMSRRDQRCSGAPTRYGSRSCRGTPARAAPACRAPASAR